jgi:hypothetical protein
MPRLGLKYRCEFHMGNMVYLFRTREWLRKHGCAQEPGEQWRAASADWYRERGYVERPIARWYVLYQNGKVVSHDIPWPVKSAKAIKEEDLHDFPIRLDLPGGYRFFGKGPEDDSAPSIFIPADESRDSDLPAYIPATEQLKDFTLGPAIRPGDVFLPFMEGKWIYHFNDRAYAYVSGAGSWIVTRPLSEDENEIIPHYFLADIDAGVRTPGREGQKIACRDVSSASNERTMIATMLPSPWPCSDAAPTLYNGNQSTPSLRRVAAWFSSFSYDFFFRMTGGRVKLYTLKARPAPCDELLSADRIRYLLNEIQKCKAEQHLWEQYRAEIDAVMAELCELAPYEYAYILSTFPLLDRDQPPLPHDYRIRATNKGTEWRKISFITRDLALLTYFDYLAGLLHVKPDPARVARICPDGVPEPPEDLVAFFAEAGVDIDGRTEYAIAATGPYRNLRERVAKARELGAVAYVPTIDRRRATFVEQAAAVGGLSPDEGVLTPEMAERVLRDKAEREAKWARAMELWGQTPDPRTEPQPETTTPVPNA